MTDRAAVETEAYDEAHAFAIEALRLQESSLGPRHPQLADTLNTLGRIAEHDGDLEAAAAYHERALELLSSSGLPNEHADLVEARAAVSRVRRSLRASD